MTLSEPLMVKRLTALELQSSSVRVHEEEVVVVVVAVIVVIVVVAAIIDMDHLKEVNIDVWLIVSQET